MTGHYQIPDPKCRHKPRGIVSAGDPEDGPHASTYVCDRPECIKDAMEWAETFTRSTSSHRPLPSAQ